MSRKSKIERFFLELSDFQDSDKREKNIDFSIEYSSTSAVFSIWNLMTQIQLVVADN